MQNDLPKNELQYGDFVSDKNGNWFVVRDNMPDIERLAVMAINTKNIEISFGENASMSYDEVNEIYV